MQINLCYFQFGLKSYQFIYFRPLFTNYYFVLKYCTISGFLNLHVSHLNHETFKLCLQNTLNMSKTTRVYFGVLQFSHFYRNFVLEIHTMRFVCSMSSPFFSYLLPMTFLILSFHFYSLCHVYITSLSSIHNTRTSTSEANTFLYVYIYIFLSYTLSRLASYILSRIASYTLSMFRLFQKRLNLCSDTTKRSCPPDPRSDPIDGSEPKSGV